MTKLGMKAKLKGSINLITMKLKRKNKNQGKII